jgi:hypothetical protein
MSITIKALWCVETYLGGDLLLGAISDTVGVSRFIFRVGSPFQPDARS